MRVRHLLAIPKQAGAETAWSETDMPPRWCPVYSKTRPSRAGWHWRSAHVSGDGEEFMMVAICNPRRGNWKSMLLLKATQGYSVVARFEHHESHPGLHVHTHCQRSGIEVGAGGMDSLARIPAAGAPHRRTAALTLASFWRAAQSFYRVADDYGELFAYGSW
jgi:hypothetical protein